jgi:hypothetical protein
MLAANIYKENVADVEDADAASPTGLSITLSPTPPARSPQPPRRSTPLPSTAIRYVRVACRERQPLLLSPTDAAALFIRMSDADAGATPPIL